MSLIEGRVSGICFILIMILSVAYAISAGKKGLTKVKAPAGLTAMSDAVAQAVEKGRPIHYAPGGAALVGRDSVQVLAGLTLMGYAANLAAKQGARMVVSLRYPELVPLSQDIVRREYSAEDRLDLYSDDDSVRYLSTQQFAFASGIMGAMHREKVAANFMMGPFTAETLVIAEAGTQIGAVQIGGMSTLGNIPFMIAACDYVLIGEEFFTAAAIVGGDSAQLASIRGQDLLKGLIGLIVVAGIILKAVGSFDLKALLLK